jgi:hypothetical protein
MEELQVEFTVQELQVELTVQEPQRNLKVQLIMPHLEVLSVVNDDRVVIENRLFDYPIKLKDKYAKYAVVCQLQNRIHSNECKYKKCSFK